MIYGKRSVVTNLFYLVLHTWGVLGNTFPLVAQLPPILFSGGAAILASLSSPSDVKFDLDGNNLFIMDCRNSRVRVIAGGDAGIITTYVVR